MIPQFPRRNDGEVFNFSKIEQFLVAGHEHIGFPGVPSAPLAGFCAGIKRTMAKVESRDLVWLFVLVEAAGIEPASVSPPQSGLHT